MRSSARFISPSISERHHRFHLIARAVTAKLQETFIWAAVCDVAKELFAAGPLDYDQVQQIVERWVTLPFPSDWLTATGAQSDDPSAGERREFALAETT
jgi:hypothetical protein